MTRSRTKHLLFIQTCFFALISTAAAFCVHRETLPRTQRTLLQLQGMMTPTAAAATALTGSALTGMWMERQKPNSGILTSLTVSSMVFSKVAPSSHVLYEMCWDTFLPASLALLLLGMPQSVASEQADIQHESTTAVVRRLALPFGLASLGSLLGCMLSFFLCRSFPSSSKLCLSPADAAWAGACLSASFVGGSVNFLATAAWIASQTTTLMVSAMTAADLIVMAVYFALMAAAAQSVPLQQWFDQEKTPPRVVSTTTISAPRKTETISTTNAIISTTSFHIPTAVLVTTVAFGLVRLGQVVERICAPYIPGMACAFLAAVTPWMNRYMPPRRTAVTAPPLSQFCFFLLFAAVGVTADWKEALQSGPACSVFSSVALLIHGLVVLGVGRYLPGRLVDYLIASNAAIGGPATAATFCGTLQHNTQALVIAATVWGVFGYAIGTTVGVGMYRLLLALL